MIATLKELQLRRSRSSVFAGKKSYLTPRDIFRWGDRQPQGYQQLGEEGYMLLGERMRNEDERKVVKEVVEKHCKAHIDLDTLYSRQSVEELARLLRPSGGACVLCTCT